jgi:hypothetical protein
VLVAEAAVARVALEAIDAVFAIVHAVLVVAQRFVLLLNRRKQILHCGPSGRLYTRFTIFSQRFARFSNTASMALLCR